MSGNEADPISVHSSQDQVDDEPMVYETPQDYATSAREERDRLIAGGAAPDSVILQSEFQRLVPRHDGEPPEDFTQRYVKTMMDMIGRGVIILNDDAVADVAPDSFVSPDGRTFDLGPQSGATKGEYREFTEWFAQLSDAGGEVPVKWLKFESTAGRSDPAVES
jgi:hypothetical protein